MVILKTKQTLSNPTKEKERRKKFVRALENLDRLKWLNRIQLNHRKK